MILNCMGLISFCGFQRQIDCMPHLEEKKIDHSVILA